jgi:succinate dehydrogenase / fumarate reductase, cytochrome b subunit
MNWFIEMIGKSSIGRKLIMALTGLFLVTFLIVHLSGNFQLLIDDGGLQFNAYAKFMTTNPVIKTTSYGLYAFILLHIIYSIILTLHNKNARPVSYAATSGKSSAWSSRNMGLLGTIILIFLVIHLRGFWYEMHWGGIPMDQNGNKDLYKVVAAAFAQWWYVVIYVVSMIGLGFHLIHGFQSAFQTLGLNHKKYLGLIKGTGLVISVLIPAAFAAIPVIMFVKSL